MMGWFTRATAATTKRKIGSFNEPEVHGLIEHYGLTSWWLATFSREERREIEGWASDGYDGIIDPQVWPVSILTQGQVTTFGRSATEFLQALYRQCEMVTSSSIRPRIATHIHERGATENPALYNGVHFASYPGAVEQLKRDGRYDDAEKLLLALVSCAEADARVGIRVTDGPDVPPPWYYDELGKIYRRRKDYAAEVAILERCKAQWHGHLKPRLAERLARAQELLETQFNQ